MHVTIGICTRNRGDSIARPLRSILASRYPDFDLIIVDQSVSDDTAEAVQRVVQGDPRVTYIRSQTIGSSAAHNVAIARSQGPIVAFTDDDCEVCSDWLERIVQYFRDNEDVGLICGSVLTAVHNPLLGFIPDYPVARLRRVSSPWMKWRDGGIGANMAFRLQTLKTVGPYDELLGPGSPLYTAEDCDMTYRVLRSPYNVLDVPDAYVVHYGYRTWAEGRPMMRKTGKAVGAAYMKHVRAGDIAVLPTLLVEAWRTISWSRLILLKPRSGIGRFLGFVSGMRASFDYAVDRERRLYLETVSQKERRRTVSTI